MSDETLPLGWAVVPLKDVATKIVDGSHNPPAKREAGLPMLSGRNIENGRIIFDDFRLIAEADFESEDARTRITVGDVLLTIVGTIGRSAVVISEQTRFTLQRSVAVVTPSGIDPKFLSLQFQAPRAQRFFAENAKGTAQKGVYLKTLGATPIHLPPLAEQKRIVAKIEELFSELEAGEESLRVARRQLGVYRQSLLKQAFEGKLTEKWRTQNPAQLESPAQLLARIQSARQSRYEAELKEWARELKQWEKSAQEEKRPAKPRRPNDVQLPERDQVENLPDLPSAWAWISVANCAVEISDGPFGSNLKSDDYVSAGVRVVRLENIGAGEFIGDKESFISPEKYQKLKRHTVRPGDIVVASFINDAVRAALIPPSIEYAVNKADCFQVHCFGDTISADFLVRCFGARYFFKQLEQLVHGVGRPRINTTQLGEAFVPLCSLPEQQEIVRLLDEQFEVIERNERELDAALQGSEALRQAILKKAFTGRLVPQDPSDEPASTLLARLQNGGAEGEASAKASRGRKARAPVLVATR